MQQRTLSQMLTELDARRLYLGEGCSSLFTYCTKVLHLSEHAAYGRIEAARAARRFPVILQLLADGAVTLTTIGLLAPHLTGANHGEVLASAQHKSKREVEQLVARIDPRSDLPATVRKLPPPKSSPASIAAATAPPVVGPPLPSTSTATMPITANRSAEVKPLAPERFKIQFTVSRETYDQLRRVQDLLRHSIPTGDVARISSGHLRSS